MFSLKSTTTCLMGVAVVPSPWPVFPFPGVWCPWLEWDEDVCPTAAEPGVALMIAKTPAAATVGATAYQRRALLFFGLVPTMPPLTKPSHVLARVTPGSERLSAPKASQQERTTLWL
jgi:hypothetical protein